MLSHHSTMSRDVNGVKLSFRDTIHLEALPYKYPMRTVTTIEAEIRQIEACMAHGYPRLLPRPLTHETLSIVGFGPSLKDMWPLITQPCITMSGSHDFLITRGVIPTYYTNCDGRDHQVKFLQHPHPDVTYLMATVCATPTWAALNGHKIIIWHNAHGEHVVDWIAEHDQGGLLVAGGSNIGLTSIHLGGVLGFRSFKLFGMDGNFHDKTRHAGQHPDPVPQRVIIREAGGYRWNTSPQMSNACDELVWLLRDTPIEVEVYGDTLQAAVLRDVPHDYWHIPRRVTSDGVMTKASLL
jgi:6-hydroxymethylpterin diphosphokinase MptE-like protein